MRVREEGTKRIKKRQSHLSRIKIRFIVRGNGLISKWQIRSWATVDSNSPGPPGKEIQRLDLKISETRAVVELGHTVVFEVKRKMEKELFIQESGTKEVQRGHQILELELQVVVNAMWVLGIEPRSSGQTPSALNQRAISPAPQLTS
ncbi:hypothetical protein STEG23_004967 [Scotinomys teguina]